MSKKKVQMIKEFTSTIFLGSFELFVFLNKTIFGSFELFFFAQLNYFLAH